VLFATSDTQHGFFGFFFSYELFQALFQAIGALISAAAS
jgi:hypothetical protein